MQYVEAHGTGTPLGDPIEATALGAALGRGRPAAEALRIGSAKTNVGHLEAAAGIVGLLKVLLSLVCTGSCRRTATSRGPTPRSRSASSVSRCNGS